MSTEQAKKRPADYNELLPTEQWEIDKALGILDYEGVTELEWVRYEFATIVHYYKLPSECEARIDRLFERLAKGKS